LLPQRPEAVSAEGTRARIVGVADLLDFAVFGVFAVHLMLCNPKGDMGDAILRLCSFKEIHYNGGFEGLMRFLSTNA